MEKLHSSEGKRSSIYYQSLGPIASRSPFKFSNVGTDELYPLINGIRYGHHCPVYVALNVNSARVAIVILSTVIHAFDVDCICRCDEHKAQVDLYVSRESFSALRSEHGRGK